MTDLEFTDAPDLEDGELALRLTDIKLAEERSGVPAYAFSVCDAATGQKMGHLSFRAGHNDNLYYHGNIGYSIDPPYRGRHYAAKACRLVYGLAKTHGMEQLIITCDPDNTASRRTCERLGGELVEIADLPADHYLYKAGSRKKCIYLVRL